MHRRGAPGRPAHGPAEVAGCWRDEHGGGGASAECDEPVSSGSDSHRYVSDSDGWRCQRMHIRPSPRVRTIIARACGREVITAAILTIRRSGAQANFMVHRVKYVDAFLPHSRILRMRNGERGLRGGYLYPWIRWTRCLRSATISSPSDNGLAYVCQ